MPKADTKLALAQARQALIAGQLGEAERQCRRVLTTDPRHVEAMRMLAQVCRNRGRNDEADEHLQKILRLRPRDVSALVMLADVLMLQGRSGEAAERLEKALRLDPTYAPALSSKAELAYRQQRYQEAMAVVDDAVAAGEDEPPMAEVWSLAAIQLGRAEEAAGVLNRHLQNDDLHPQDRRSLAFALGAALERCGRYDEAFVAYTEGNELSYVGYDAAAVDAAVDELIAAFTAERLAALPRPAEPSDVPIFIVGMPRSGSTLIEQILHAHRDVEAAGEVPFLGEIVQSMPLLVETVSIFPKCLIELNQADLGTLAGAYLSRLRAGHEEAIRVVDKNLGNYHHAGLIGLLFPGARIIHSRRDPVDTCLSCFCQKLAHGGHGYAARLETLAHAYHAYDRLMRHWSSVMGDSILDVQYETLVDDLDGTTRQVLDFLGLPWDDACLRYYESDRNVLTLSVAQVTKPIYRSAIGRAERFGKNLDPLREALAYDTNRERI